MSLKGYDSQIYVISDHMSISTNAILFKKIVGESPSRGGLRDLQESVFLYILDKNRGWPRPWPPGGAYLACDDVYCASRLVFYYKSSTFTNVYGRLGWSGRSKMEAWGH